MRKIPCYSMYISEPSSCIVNQVLEPHMYNSFTGFKALQNMWLLIAPLSHVNTNSTNKSSYIYPVVQFRVIPFCP